MSVIPLSLLHEVLAIRSKLPFFRKATFRKFDGATKLIVFVKIKFRKMVENILQEIVRILRCHFHVILATLGNTLKKGFAQKGKILFQVVKMTNIFLLSLCN